MQRRIFIGSSTEGFAQAQRVRDMVAEASEHQVDCLMWPDAFQPGFITFESLENVFRQCCGAVLVATPDDAGVIREQEVRCPRANVMLEFGLLAGRLGRHNVAVCQVDGAVLPSDLQGLNVIRLDSTNSEPPSLDGLRMWTARLLGCADRISRVDLVHGYTGRWNFDLHLSKWRDLAVDPPFYAGVNGVLDLVIPTDGHSGYGLAHGRILFQVPAGSGVYVGEFRTAHEITTAVCAPDGSLEMVTEAFALQRVSSDGTPPPQLVGLERPAPWSARWELRPGNEPRTLEGHMRTSGAMATEGTATAVLMSDVL